MLQTRLMIKKSVCISLAMCVFVCFSQIGCTAQNTQTPTKPLAKKDNFAQFRPLPEALNVPSPLLVPISKSKATARAKALQKERMGLSSWKELEPALIDSLRYAKAWPQNSRAIEHNGKRITWATIVDSLELLQKLLPRLDKEPALLAENFTWLHLSPKTHFTGYYSPIIKASRVRKKGYTSPIYRMPEELAPELAYCLPTHTCPEEAFARVIRPDPPYFSRVAIDMDKALEGKNLEIAYLQHPVDTYALMLQGSGLLAFEDGTTQAVLFAALNGQSGQSMAGYLMKTKQLAKKDATMEGIRKWWDSASHKKRRAFLTAGSGYVFFRYGAAKPQATIGAPLTPWVSMAADERVLPLGGILAYSIPTTGKDKAGVLKGDTQTLNGLGFAQDTGGAIKMRRIDLYAGEGSRGHTGAMSVYTKGDIWLLLKK